MEAVGISTSERGSIDPKLKTSVNFDSQKWLESNKPLPHRLYPKPQSKICASAIK